MISHESDSLLQQGAHDLGVSINSRQQAQLNQYLDELELWNRTYNLTAVRDREQMVIRHLLDSLSILPFIEGERLLDVGSGAGLPGIPIAIARPELQVTMLDSNGKKTRFMRHACRTLGLSNTHVVDSRIADWQPQIRFDAITARAFSSPAVLLDSVSHLLSTDGTVLAMTGKLDSEQKVTDHGQFILADQALLQVPMLDETRHLLIYRTADTWEG